MIIGWCWVVLIIIGLDKLGNNRVLILLLSRLYIHLLFTDDLYLSQYLFLFRLCRWLLGLIYCFLFELNGWYINNILLVSLWYFMFALVILFLILSTVWLLNFNFFYRIIFLNGMLLVLVFILVFLLVFFLKLFFSWIDID